MSFEPDYLGGGFDATFADLTVTGDAEVNGELTENGAPVMTALQATRNIYVNGATGDDTNDGRAAGTAFKTIQKGVNIAGYQASNNQTIVNVAAGTYHEPNVVVPKYAIGEILILGDRTTPSDIVLTGDLSLVETHVAFTHENNSALLVIEGIQFEDYFRGVRVENAAVSIGGCIFEDMGQAVSGVNYANILYFDNGVFNTTYNGTTAFYLGWMTVVSDFCRVIISDDIVATNVDRFVNAQNRCRVALSIGYDLNITFKTTGPQCFFLLDSDLFTGGDIIADGNKAVPVTNSAFVFISGGSCQTFFLGGDTWTIDDFDYVFLNFGVGQTYWSDDSSVGMTLTNVNNKGRFGFNDTGYDDTGLMAGGDVVYEIGGYDANMILTQKIAYFNR